MAVKQKSVAIVDDDEAFLEATAAFLQAIGYATLSYPSAEAFLELAPTEEVSHLLTDVNMPGMSGLELQSIVRARHPGVHVIIMTALSDDSVRRRASAGGATCLLRKPILGDALIRCLEAP